MEIKLDEIKKLKLKIVRKILNAVWEDDPEKLKKYNEEIEGLQCEIDFLVGQLV